jgi:hypothetical protein
MNYDSVILISIGGNIYYIYQKQERQSERESKNNNFYTASLFEIHFFLFEDLYFFKENDFFILSLWS